MSKPVTINCTHIDAENDWYALVFEKEEEGEAVLEYWLGFEDVPHLSFCFSTRKADAEADELWPITAEVAAWLADDYGSGYIWDVEVLSGDASIACDPDLIEELEEFLTSNLQHQDLIERVRNVVDQRLAPIAESVVTEDEELSRLGLTYGELETVYAEDIRTKTVIDVLADLGFQVLPVNDEDGLRWKINAQPKNYHVVLRLDYDNGRGPRYVYFDMNDDEFSLYSICEDPDDGPVTAINFATKELADNFLAAAARGEVEVRTTAACGRSFD